MKKVSRLTTAVGAFTLGIGLLGTSFALAAPPSAPAVPSVPVKVNTAEKVSLTIVKYSGPEVEKGSRPNGSNERLEGITFKVTRIDYQGSSAPAIGTAAWWDWAYRQKTDGTLSEARKADSFDLTTDEKGQACLSSEAKTTSADDKVQAGTSCKVDAGVKQGLYLVEETGTTAKNKKNYRGALPFFITLPLAEGDNSESATWNYNPVLEPKNQEFSLDKKLTDATENKVTYTVSSSIPTSNLVDEGDNKYDEKYPFGIEDIYPAGLTPNESGTKVFIKGTGDKKELSKEADYKVELTENNTQELSGEVWKGALVKNKKTVAVYFTKDGAKKLAKAVKEDATAKVYYALSFTVIDHTDALNNKVAPHDPGSRKTPSDDTVITNNDGDFINLSFTKVDAQKAETKLQGAVFNFYKCSQDEAGNLATVGKALPGFAENSNFNNTDKSTYDFSTSKTGTVTAYHVLNAAKVTKNDENGVPSSDKYVMCAVEKTAPEGYKKNPYPIKVETSSVAHGAEVTKTIPNTKTTFFDRLPKTGAAGIILLLVLGGSMVVAGVAMRRRNSEEA